ncbi:bacteriocin-protection protein [Chryseobacterium sp. Leaf405]|uniref:YdeI/OmpD-associated family protein n=1 Tax=Chryseobacterium sp. Leaf405 TaxID=1736367 RepID=UPI0006FE7F12|nr:YdeI/OmpD-associated family protein [Chryseobacterium sp. Leaf405]KQT26327.1 bacteriocin-protection protein [Chryseobacterium sp. Leaf405]
MADNQKQSATFFETPEKFRKWLQNHYKTEKELLVGFYKVNTKKPSMTWPESVDQVLCFGWIDGVRKSIDEESYSIRFTPRKSTSIWSTVNVKKIEELTKAGLMTAEGIKAFELRKEEKSGIYSHEKEPAVLDSDYEKQFKANRKAWEFFNNQAPSYKKVMLHWIMRAKQEKTRLSRLEKTIKESESGKRVQ